MLGFKFLGNTKVPHHKNTAAVKAVEIAPPREILLPMQQHIGAPATPIVKEGDTVMVGQKIAEANGYVSSPIYSSVSGTVSKIENYLRPDGKIVQAVRITSDGEMNIYDGITIPAVDSLDSLIEAVRESGVVGLGGAGFPTAVKLDAIKKGGIDTVVLNGAECEPYITADTRTMLDESSWIYEGIKLLKTYAPSVKKFIFGIESNKKEAIEEIARIFRDDDSVSVLPLPPLYPQGAEKILIYNTTGRVVPEGKLPADVGIIVMNVTTLSSVAKYVKTGFPLVERCVTVDGSAIKEPKNLIVPIGTSIGEILASVSQTEDMGKVLFGGPMMGIAASNLNEPITKTTGAITVLAKKDSKLIEPTACIHCGSCVYACPNGLNPTAYAKALNISNEKDKVELLEAEKINLCIECGCCSFVCPAHRPLVQNNKLAKAAVREYKAHIATLK